MSLQDKAEINGLKKQTEELTKKLSSVTKEAEHLKSENTTQMAQINDLKDQVNFKTLT